MRIAFVTLGFAPLRMSGLDISGERLVRGLLEAGHHVTVIAGAHKSISETMSHPSLEILRVYLGHSNWIGFAFRAAWVLKKLGGTRSFDVVHFWDVHFAYGYRGKYVASLQQSFHQRLMALDSKNLQLPLQLYYKIYYRVALRFFESPAARAANGLIAGSVATRNEFICNYGITPEKIALASHGIDTHFFHRIHATDSLRSQLNIEPNEPILFFAGFVTPRKGLDYLAQALPLVQPAPRLIIAGRWSTGYRARFFSLLGSAARVVEAGFVPDEQMPAYYSLADLYVSPSLLEGFGIPLVESLACETPVVATDVGSVSEVVGPGGILVPPREPVVLANTISQLLQNSSRRRELGIQGREHVKRHFDVQRMVNDTLHAYQRFKPG